MKNLQFAVIGLGRFGTSIMEELSLMGYEVLAIDIDPNLVNNAKDIATYAIEADTTDEQVLKAVGIRNMDVVVVAIGDNVQSNIMTTILLKEMGVPKVVSKAQNHLHGKVLERIGTDMVVYPERDMAIRVAHSLVSQSVIDYINLSSEYSILEIVTPTVFIGKTLRDNKVRENYDANIIAIKRGDGIIVNPTAGEIIQTRDILVVLGRNLFLERLSELE